jgi:hypothetical protein
MPAPAATTVVITRAQSGHYDGPLIFTGDQSTNPATITLQARTKDQYGAPFVDTVTWSSSRPDLATVVAGVVTPVGFGTCSIIATSVANPAISDSVQFDNQPHRDRVY